MPECVEYSRKWLCLGNKYFLTTHKYQYQYTEYNKTGIYRPWAADAASKNIACRSLSRSGIAIVSAKHNNNHALN